MTRRSLALRRPDAVSALRPLVAGFVAFTGATGEYLHDDRPVLTSVGTLEYGIKVKLSALNRAHNLAGWGSGASRLSVNSNPPGNTMTIAVINSVAGVIGGAASSTVIPATAATQPTWLRARVTVSTAICEYWYSNDATDEYEQVSWTPIGTPQTGTGAGTTPTLAGTDLQIVGNIGITLPSMAGNVYAFVEKVDGVRRSWFTNADIPASPKTEFVSAGGGQLWDMELWQTTSFTSTESYSGGLRADFAFNREITGLSDETLLGVVDLDHQSVRVSYQPALIPDHPTLGAYVEAMLVRSTAGYAATNLDGLLMMRYLAADPALNDGWASTIDSGLNGQQWYYYSLFARYDATSGWFKVAEEGWLNPAEYGYPDRMWWALPTYYRRIDNHNTWIFPGYFRRICDAIGYEMDVLRSYATTLGDVWDFEKLSAKLLPEAGAALGLPQESANGDRRLRTLVGNAMALRKQKGTQQGIEGYVAALTGYPTRAYEGLNLLHRIQHAEWPNSFTAGTFSGDAGSDNNPGWSSQTGATVYGQVSRQTAASNEGSPIGLADGGFYLRVSNTTGASSQMDITYGSDNAANGTNGILSMIPVIGGHKYRFSTAIKASVASTTVNFKVDWYDQYGAAAGTSGNIVFVTIGTTWLRVYTAAAITAPATARYAKLHLLVPAGMAASAHLNIWRPLFGDVAWRPEGIPTQAKGNDALSSVQPEDNGTFRFWAYYEPPREVKINIYPNRTNFALNSDFTLNNQPPGAWSTYDAPTYAQLPVAYDSYADIIDAAPDWETSYADMAAGLYPFSQNAPTIIYDPAAGRMHVNKTTAPYGYTLMHTYFEAADLEGMSAAIGAYSSASTRGDAPGYLTPLTGTASMPDPGPFPAKCTLVYKILGPTVAAGATNHTIAAQYDADPQRSWLLRRQEATGGYAWTVSPGGTVASAVSRSLATLSLPNTDQYLALSIDLDVGSGNQTLTPWSSTDGVTWVADTAQASTLSTVRPFDSTGPIRIGAYTSTQEPFEGRIYAVEMRTGADPNLGSGSVPMAGSIDLPGVNGNYVSIPNYAGINITGDLTLIADVALPDWTPATTYQLIAKWNPGTLSYKVYIQSSGVPILQWSADGTNTGNAVCTGNLGSLEDGARQAVRVDIDVDNGSAGRTITFWQAPTAAGPWTQIGTPVIAAGITSIFGGTSSLFLGTDSTSANAAPMSIYGASIRNGQSGTATVGGTEVFNFNGVTDLPPGANTAATTVLTNSGQTMTLNKAGAGTQTSITPGGPGTYWRFDANDYPGTGTTYTDPRGKVWTLTTAAAITPYSPASQGTKLSMAMEWYTDNDVIYKMLGADGNPIRTYSPEYTLTTTEGRYELVNVQPPKGALYGRLLVIVSNVVAHDTSLTWCLIEDAPYPEGYFNGNFPDGDDGDFYFAIGTGFTGAAHMSPSVYYQQFRHFAYGSANSDALSTLMPRLLPFRRSFKIVHGATGLYNKIV